MEYNLKEIGDRIREMRKAAGYKSQEAFGAALSPGKAIDRKTVARWEDGERLPDPDIMLRMCERDMFDCDLDHILGTLEPKTYDAKFIMDETGLTEEAVEQLRGYQKAEREAGHIFHGRPENNLVPALISFMLTYEDKTQLYNHHVLEMVVETMYRQRKIIERLDELPEATQHACFQAFFSAVDSCGFGDRFWYEFYLSNDFDYAKLSNDFPEESPESILHDLADFFDPLREYFERDSTTYKMTKQLSELLDAFIDSQQN